MVQIPQKLMEQELRLIGEKNVQVSRWRDLNPRPIPYQGIAQPGYATAARMLFP